MANTIQVKFSAVTSTPTSLAVGELAYSDASDTLFIGDNTGTPVAIGGAAAFTKLAGIEAGAEVNDVFSVAGKTGAVTLVVADLTDFASTIATYLPLAGGTMTGAITLAADPASAMQPATKQYVDNYALGLDFKQSVRVASTANLAVASAVVDGATVDGVTLATGDRILLKDQSTASENGIYIVVASGAASRSPDADTTAEVTKGMFMYVESGTVNGGTAYVCTSAGTLGSSSVVFTTFGGGATYSAGTGLTLTGTVFALDNHSAALLTSGTLPDARLSANVLLVTSTIDGGSF